MFAHFRIPVVRSEEELCCYRVKIKIKEKGTDKREEIEQEKEKKVRKSIDKRYTLQYESLAPLSRQDFPSLYSVLKRIRL